MTRRRATVALLAALAVVAACGVDFTDLPRDQPAAFDLTLQHLDLDDRELVVSALLDPGYDGDGRPRAVTDEVLRVGGRLLPPGQVDWRGRRSWNTGWTVDHAPELAALLVEPPAVAGDAPPALTVALPHRTGPHTLTVAPGDSAVFHIEPGAGDLGPSRSRQWALHAQVTGRRHLSLAVGDTGAVPQRIAIPTSILPDGWSEMAVRVSTSQTLESGDAGDHYTIRVSASSHLHWRVLAGT